MLQASIPEIDGTTRGTFALPTYLLCFVSLSRKGHEITLYGLRKSDSNYLRPAVHKRFHFYFCKHMLAHFVLIFRHIMIYMIEH